MTITRQSYNKNSGSGTSVVLTLAGTPSNNDCLAVGVAIYNGEKPVTISGLGATYTSRLNIVSALGNHAIRVFTCQAASYTGTQITVTIGDSGTQRPVYAGVARYSGVDTTQPVNATGYYEGPASVDDNDLRSAITSTVNDSMLICFAAHQPVATFTVPSGQTSISVNDQLEIDGDYIHLDAWQKEAPVAGPYILGGIDSLSVEAYYAVGILALTPTGSGVATPTARQLTLRDRKFNMTLREWPRG